MKLNPQTIIELQMETGAAKAACRIGSKLAAGRIRVLYKITTAEGLRILKREG